MRRLAVALGLALLAAGPASAAAPPPAPRRPASHAVPPPSSHARRDAAERSIAAARASPGSGGSLADLIASFARKARPPAPRPAAPPRTAHPPVATAARTRRPPSPEMAAVPHRAAAAGHARRTAATVATRTGPGIGLSPGSALIPVRGPVARSFGQAGPDGTASGVTLAGTPGEPVVSPCAGTVDFAGRFRSYGPMAIVDCGRGYRFVLAGLDRIAAPVGAAIRRGEPIGRMPAASQGLFVQLRRETTPIDPSGFMREPAGPSTGR